MAASLTDFRSWSPTSSPTSSLLSVLWHLNFSVDPLTPLLSLLSTSPSLHDSITSDDSHKKEQRTRRDFLSSWNGISLFSDDQITQTKNIQLYTDAAPSAVDCQWFTSRLSPSSASYETYSVVIAAFLQRHKWSKKKKKSHPRPLRQTHNIFNQGCSHSSDTIRWLRLNLRPAPVLGWDLGIIDSLILHIPEIQILGTRLGSSPNSSPPVSSHHLHLNTQFLHLTIAPQRATLNRLCPKLWCPTQPSKLFRVNAAIETHAP